MLAGLVQPNINLWSGTNVTARETLFSLIMCLFIVSFTVRILLFVDILTEEIIFPTLAAETDMER